MNAHVCVCVNVVKYVCVYVEWCLRERGREICVDEEVPRTSALSRTSKTKIVTLLVKHFLMHC